jgi:spore maturation protein CgeB
MKILIIGKFSEDQFGYHISDTLKDMGHSVIELEFGLKNEYNYPAVVQKIRQANSIFSEALNNFTFFRKLRLKKLDKILNENKIDLTIVTHDFLFPDEAEFIKKRTLGPLVLWFPDTISNFNKAIFIISDYDFLFFKDPYLVTTLNKDYNITNAFYLPECFNPKYHKTIELTDSDIKKYGCDISTYGSAHVFRIKLFSQLRGYNIKIWGPSAPLWINDKNKIETIFTGIYVTNTEKSKAVLSATINLNTLHPAEVTGLNTRAFEIAGIGGFQMIHWRPGLNQLFEDQKEIVSFKNYIDMKEKIDFYLANESIRKKIAKAGWERAKKDHTFHLRLQLLLDTASGNQKGYEI